MTATPTGTAEYCPNLSSYAKGCRCASCRGKRARDMRQYRRNLAEKKWGAVHPSDKVSPEAAEKAVWSAVHDLGLTFNEIHRVTGLSKQSVNRLYYGKRTFIERKTEDKVLAAYGPEAQLRRSFTGKEPTPWEPHKWKVYGLLAQGWTLNLLKGVLRAGGRPPGFLSNFNNTRRPNIERASVEHLDWLVEKIGDRHGPSKFNCTYFQTRGIFPLIHYTEDGELIRASLTKEQRARVRFWHGKSTGRGHGTGSRTGQRRGH